MNLKNIKKSMQILWKNKPYLFLAITIALGSGYLLYIFSSASMILYMDSVFFIISSLGMSALISILFGIDISLIAYKFNLSRKMGLKESSSSIFGVIGGVIGSGCPICGATVLGFLGVSGGLAILPFNGLGLKALSLGLMLFATYKISENISNCKECKVKGVKK